MFVIDAKCAFQAFVDGQSATDETMRVACMARHAAAVRSHMTKLSNKAYWSQLEASPDFVAMFVPGDGFLAAALDRLPDLMTEAMDKRVLLVTPTTLFALCKAVAYGWRVEEQAVNARKIADLGRELYKRISVMGEHAAGIGKALGQAVDRYNRFAASLETQVLTQAKRFEGYGAASGKDLETPAMIEASPRPLTKLAGTQSEADSANIAAE